VSRIKVVNDIRNGRASMAQKDAVHYVALGRAEWVGPDQLRLVLSHPANIAAAARARAWEVDSTPNPDDRIARSLMLYGTARLAATDHPVLKHVSKRPVRSADHSRMSAEQAQLETLLDALQVQSRRAEEAGEVELVERRQFEADKIRKRLRDMRDKRSREDYVARESPKRGAMMRHHKRIEESPEDIVRRLRIGKRLEVQHARIPN